MLTYQTKEWGIEFTSPNLEQEIPPQNNEFVWKFLEQIFWYYTVSETIAAVKCKNLPQSHKVLLL